jgi:hypothetical protein
MSTRYYPGGRLRVPGDDVLLAIASGLILPLVTADVLLFPGPWAQIMTPVGVPFPWEGNPYPLDGATLIGNASREPEVLTLKRHHQTGDGSSKRQQPRRPPLTSDDHCKHADLP